MVAIDISYAQTTNINFVAMRLSVDTVIMKAGGSNSGRYVDSKYRWFEPRARAAGMRIGHYWFNGTGDAIADAQFFVANLSHYTPNDLLALDVESEGAMGYWGPDKALAFCREVERLTGRKCDVYMSSSVTRAQNWAPLVAAGSKLWVAQYGTNSGIPEGRPVINHWPTYKLWQYSSNGSVPGYGARLDVNVINEAEWTHGDVTPIIEKKPRNKKMYLTMDDSGTGYLHLDNGGRYTFGNPVAGVGAAAQYAMFNDLIYGDKPLALNKAQEDIIWSIINWAQPKPVAPVLTDTQIQTIAVQVAAAVPKGTLTPEEIENAVVDGIKSVTFGAQ